jgi:hypothetical protein
MNEMLKRGKNEPLLTYFKRITDNRRELDLDYSEWAELILGENKYSSDNARKAYYIIKPMLDMLDKDEIEDDNKGLSKLEKKELSLKKEKEKLKDLRRRMNKEIRECARRENTIEMIEEAIKGLADVKPLVADKTTEILEGNEAILNFSDFHLGIAISKVYCNEYNEDIARQRNDRQRKNQRAIENVAGWNNYRKAGNSSGVAPQYFTEACRQRCSLPLWSWFVCM